MRLAVRLVGITLILVNGLCLAPGLRAQGEGVVAKWSFDETAGRVTRDSVSKVEDKVESFIKYVPGVSGTGLRFDGYTTGVIRKHIPQSLPFYPLGLPDVTNREAPVALGMRAPSWTAVAVWRLDGSETVELPMHGVDAHILYPADLGIDIQAVNRKLNVRFPRPRMGCIVCV